MFLPNLTEILNGLSLFGMAFIQQGYFSHTLHMQASVGQHGTCVEEMFLHCVSLENM